MKWLLPQSRELTWKTPILPLWLDTLISVQWILPQLRKLTWSRLDTQLYLWEALIMSYFHYCIDLSHLWIYSDNCINHGSWHLHTWWYTYTMSSITRVDLAHSYTSELTELNWWYTLTLAAITRVDVTRKQLDYRVDLTHLAILVTIALFTQVDLTRAYNTT